MYSLWTKNLFDDFCSEISHHSRLNKTFSKEKIYVLNMKWNNLCIGLLLLRKPTHHWALVAQGWHTPSDPNLSWVDNVREACTAEWNIGFFKFFRMEWFTINSSRSKDPGGAMRTSPILRNYIKGSLIKKSKGKRFKR